MSIDLEAIKARLAAASPGPWTETAAKPRMEIVLEPRTKVSVILTDEGNAGWDGSIIALVPRYMERDTEGQPEWEPTLEHYFRAESDIDLIKHAPTDLAALLAEVDRLRTRDVLTTAVVEAVTEFRRHTASLSTTNTDAATAAWDATTAALDALNAGGEPS